MSTIPEEAAGCLQLTLVRHGETEFNRLRIIQGQRDIALSEVGTQQAELVAKRLSNEKFDLIYSSDLCRAKNTADAIVSKLKEKVDIIPDELLRERGFGEAEGRSLSDLIKAAKKAGKSVIEYTPPGAETHQDLLTRAQNFFSQLIRDCSPLVPSAIPMASNTLLSTYLNQATTSTSATRSPPSSGLSAAISAALVPSFHVLIVTHGGWIRSLLEYFMATYKCGFFPPNVLTTVSPNTGVTSLLIELPKRTDSGSIKVELHRKVSQPRITLKNNSIAPFHTHMIKPTCGYFFSRETDNRKRRIGISPSNVVAWRSGRRFRAMTA